MNGKLFLFADDACLFYTGIGENDNIRMMNEDLQMLYNYPIANQLALNVDKTKFMHFHDPRKRLQNNMPVMYNGGAMEQVREFRYLGLIVDSHLTWRNHVSMLCSKLATVLGVLYKVRDEIPLYALSRLYFGLVHSSLVYMVTLWGNAPISCLSRLQTLQSRIFKIIYRLPRLTPTLTFFKEHVRDVLPIKELQVFAICKFVKEALHNVTYHTLIFPQSSRSGSSRDPFRLNRVQPFTG